MTVGGATRQARPAKAHARSEPWPGWSWHDASCRFKTIGAAEGPVISGELGTGCYLPVVKGGEPGGTWVGNGHVELGFHDAVEDRSRIRGRFALWGALGLIESACDELVACYRAILRPGDENGSAHSATARPA